MTFFDNFKEYTKPYTRQRSTIVKNDIGENVKGAVSSSDFMGIIIKKSISNKTIKVGDSAIPYDKADAVLYVSMDVDVKKGDIIVDGDVKYRAGFLQTQDDFTEKNSHKTLQLELID